MHKEKIELYEERIYCFYQRIKQYIISDSILLNAEYFVSSNPVKFADKKHGKFIPVAEGERWGDK
ncbi:MAG: hypothetical protein U9O87_02520, partial [Verrucomicrobiota bacterium]|nr:hypothetical protein [Verrucomicrobiota bacterium]